MITGALMPYQYLCLDFFRLIPGTEVISAIFHVM